MPIDRRGFLLSSAAALAACSGDEQDAPAPEEPAQVQSFDHALGAQLYTLRSILPDNPAEILKSLSSIGYTEVEVLQATFADLQPMIEDAGLKSVSMHMIAEVITGSWGDREKPQHTSPEAVAQFAADAGLSYLVMPYLGRGDRGDTLDHYKRLAEKLNSAGQAAKDAGLGFAYHNHAFEFEPIEGSTPLAVLMENTDPELVQLELDIFWVSVTGADPVALLEQYAGRVPLVHLKDKAAGTPEQFIEGVEATAFEEVGDGSIDFPAVLAACQSAGVEHYIVEQDQTPGDPIASLRQSYDYLRAVEV